TVTSAPRRATSSPSTSTSTPRRTTSSARWSSRTNRAGTPLAPTGRSMAEVPSRTEKRTFGVVFGAAAFLFLWTVAPIWVPVFLGVLLAVVAMPIQRAVERKVHGHARLVAAALTAFTVVVGSGLVFFIGFVVVRELVRFLAAGSAHEYARAAIDWLHSRPVSALL